MKKSLRGFTLIELLVVIAIIGILASIVLASLNTARKKGRDARRVADFKQIQLALELYYDGNSSVYPTYGTIGSATTALASVVTQGYISVIPSDPTNSGSYVYNYVSTDGAAAPAACAAATCGPLGYILKGSTETNNITYAAVAAGTSGATCTVSTAAPYNYCVRN